MNILFIGDVFGAPGVKTLAKELPHLKQKHAIDFVVVQGENISGRKGLNYRDYQKLTKLGVNAFTMGNHVWAKNEIFEFIDQSNIIRPLNVGTYPGHGSLVFKVRGQTLRITSLMGISFNELRLPWKENVATNFFDAIDPVIAANQADFHLIDFHAETTSEKYVFGLYLDGQVDVVVGTHTHVQTADEKVLPKGTLYITDVGMTGPANAAIGADFEAVYTKMRYDSYQKFIVSKNQTQINAVVITLNQTQKTIKRLNYLV